jgi:hypothetical protein
MKAALIHTAVAAAILTSGACNKKPAAISDARPVPADTRLVISASSELAVNRVVDKYSATRLTDGTGQSWCEGKEDAGIGVTLKLSFWDTTGNQRRELELSRLYIQNGYGTAEHFSRNNRVKILKVAAGKTSFDVALKDIPEPQEVIFPQILTASEITLTIQSVYPGNKDNDTCIAEIGLFPLQIQGVSSPIGKAGQITFVMHDGRRIILLADKSVKGNACAGCQLDAPITSGTWSLRGGMVVVDYIYQQGNADCVDPAAVNPCKRTPTAGKLILSRLTPHEVTDAGGKSGTVEEWK